MRFRFLFPILCLTLPSAAGQALQASLKAVYGKGSITASAVSPDGTLIAVAATPNVVLFDGGSWERKGVLEGGHQEPVKSLMFDPSGASLASVGWTGRVRVWNVAEKRIRSRFDALVSDAAADRESEEYTLLFSADGARLRIGWRRSGSPEKFGVWRVEDGTPVENGAASFPLNTTTETWGDTLTGVVISPDGHYAVGKASDGSWQIWDTARKASVVAVPMRSFRFVRFSKESRFLLVGTYDSAGVSVVDIEAAKLLPPSQLPLKALYACDLPPREESLAVLAKQGYVLAGRPLPGQLIDLLPDEVKPWTQNWIRAGALRTCDAMPPEIDGFYRDGWFEIPKLSFAYNAPRRMWAVCVSHVYLTQSDAPRIDLWDDPTRQQVGEFTGHVPIAFGNDKKGLEYVHALTFSPDGKLLASGGHDRTVRLWDVETPQLLLTLEGHLAPVRYLAFSPNGKALLSGSEDGTLRMWELSEK